MAATTSSPGTREHSPVIPLLSFNYDDEPDEEWKELRKQIIEDGFKPMIQEAKDRLERKIQSIRGMGDLEETERARLVEEFHSEAAAMKALAKEEFEHALARERLQRRLRRDIPIPATINHQSLRLDLEHEQAATLKAASLSGGVDAEAAFRSLIDPASSPSPTSDNPSSIMTPSSEAPSELNEADAGKPDDVVAIRPGAGALSIKITRLPVEPAVNGNVWVKASDAARKYELARRRANSKAEAPQIAAPPAPPPKKWVSASDAAKQASHRRIESHGA
ncbi:hypothetical protein B0H11DRAFT_2029859 [Mycena galericulata]|nr:hypothetical protein B0H11DRAFT_2029859 [Mycena galericulata]